MTDAPLFPTEDLRRAIERASGLGLTTAEIAACFEKPLVGGVLSEKEVVENFGAEIARGRPKLKLVVAEALLWLVENARNEKVKLEAGEFFLDRLGGPRWQEHSSMDIDVVHGVIPAAHVTLAAKLAKFANAPTLRRNRPRSRPKKSTLLFLSLVMATPNPRRPP